MIQLDRSRKQNWVSHVKSLLNEIQLFDYWKTQKIHCTFVSINGNMIFQVLVYIANYVLMFPNPNVPGHMLPDTYISLSQLFPGLYVPQYLCSLIPIFPCPMLPNTIISLSYVYRSLCSPVPMFPDPYVPRSLCSPVLFS